jgi:hypothetical protein
MVSRAQPTVNSAAPNCLIYFQFYRHFLAYIYFLAFRKAGLYILSLFQKLKQNIGSTKSKLGKCSEKIEWIQRKGFGLFTLGC